MPTVMETQLTVSNENPDGWMPRAELVDGSQSIKLDCKDRACFRFLTGKALTFGSKYENSKHLLGFWVYMVNAFSFWYFLSLWLELGPCATPRGVGSLIFLSAALALPSPTIPLLGEAGEMGGSSVWPVGWLDCAFLLQRGLVLGIWAQVHWTWG